MSVQLIKKGEPFFLSKPQLEIEKDAWSPRTTHLLSLEGQYVLKFLLYYCDYSILLIAKNRASFDWYHTMIWQCYSFRNSFLCFYFQQIMVKILESDNKTTFCFDLFCWEQPMLRKFWMWAKNNLHKEFFCKVAWKIFLFFCFRFYLVCKMFSRMCFLIRKSGEKECILPSDSRRLVNRKKDSFFQKSASRC